ncbi:MAG: hypothetical protein HRU23_19135 [Gammaproteobacteria bacterium]|nr:hypothetical protein [Gammaproteobacteria bacterium]
MRDQNIDGNNNQQASGDIINNFNEPEFDPNNPNQVKCPSCFKAVSKIAIICPHTNCGAAIAEQLMKIKIREENTRTKKSFICFFVPSAALTLTGIYQSMPWLMTSGFTLMSVYILYNRFKK